MIVFPSTYNTVEEHAMKSQVENNTTILSKTSVGYVQFSVMNALALII